MSKKKFLLAAAFMVAIAFIGLTTLYPQIGIQGKGKPPKNPKTNCNNNSICESGEYNYNLTHEEQNCNDCLPKTYNLLSIDHGLTEQIVGANFNIGKIFQFKLEGVNYVDTWASAKIEDIHFLHPDIGDIEGDGFKEILAIATYKYKVGKGKKAQNYYDQKVFIFRDGYGGSLIEESSHIGYSDQYLWQTLLADVDSDGADELILHKWWQTEIYKWEGNDFVLKWSESYDVLCFRVAVGNADDDNANELLIGTCDGTIRVLECYIENGNYSFEEENTITSTESYCIDRIRIRNTDNYSGNEVIVGGNNSKITIWKYNTGLGEFEQPFQSVDLGGYTAEFDIGDIDDDTYNEIVVAPTWTQTLFVLEYDSDTGTYAIVDSESLMIEDSIKELSIGEIDHVNGDEVVFGGNEDSVYIYHYLNEEFEKVYECVYGSRGGPRVK